eukprot:358951-Chlamydomonas_euryale.AAC.13
MKLADGTPEVIPSGVHITNAACVAPPRTLCRRLGLWLAPRIPDFPLEPSRRKGPPSLQRLRFPPWGSYPAASPEHVLLAHMFSLYLAIANVHWKWLRYPALILGPWRRAVCM